jgi:ubiquinone biosynthesis protein Coq4
MEINNDSQSPAATSLSSLVAKQPLARKQKLGPIARQSELLKLACNYLSKDSKTTGVEDDEYLTIAKVGGNKLKYLPPHTGKNSRKSYK